MKIVEIIPCIFPLNGAERLVCDLSSFFADANNDVTIISLYSNKDNDVVDKLQKDKNIEIFFLDKKHGVDIKCARKLKKTIASIKPDIIHCHLDTLVTIWFSKLFKRYKIFYTFHTLINESVVGKKNKPKQFLYRRLFRKKKVFPIGISHIITKSICNYYNLNKSDVFTIYNGVPLCRFENHIAFNNRKYDFIFIGRFIELKSPTVIVSSFLKLYKKCPSVKMVMLGNGKLLEDCKKLALENKCENIDFVGFTNDVSSYLAESRVLILASRYEGNPIVINEAIASKCFVLATNVGGLPDIINENNGVLIEYTERLLEDLTFKMKWCLDNSSLIAKTLESSYESNKRNISIENCGSQYLSVFGGKKS